MNMYKASQGGPSRTHQFGSMGLLPAGITLKDYLPQENLEMLHPYWHDFPPEHPLIYTGISFIYMIMGVLSLGGNFLVMYTFCKFKILRTPSNLLVLNLSLADVVCMVSMVPECIVCFLRGGMWPFGELACTLHAFFGSICGGTQIVSLVFISYDRFNVVVRGINATPLTFGRAFLMILLAWTNGAFWAIGPLVGYGSYALDAMAGSCSYGYMDPTLSNRLYLVGQFFFCFCISLSVISYCYYFIVKAVFHHEKAMRDQAKKMNVTSLKSNDDADKTSTEIKIAKVALMNVSLWIIAWSPFAIICLIGVLGDQTVLTPLVTSLPSLLAKTACVYNPIIYSLSHPRYRKCIKQAIPWFCIDLGTESGSAVSSSSAAVDMKNTA